MNIKVLGTGCANCMKVEALVKEAVADLGVDTMLEHVTDYKAIVSYGVTATPGLVIDGVVKSAGRIPSKTEITSWIISALKS